MKMIVRRPYMFLSLLFVWLLLTGFGIGHLALGALIVLGAMYASEPLELPQTRIRSLRALIRLAGVVGIDIVRSNIAVTRVILSGPRAAERRAGFMELTVKLRDPNAVALLAIILTATPGTAWLDYNPANGRLLLHVLDLADPEDWRRLINGRYEALLNEALG